MNIFVLSQHPVLAAKYQCDKHVTKLTLESAQLLCSPFKKDTAPYKRTHYNHPCSIWTRQSIGNFKWLVEHGMALADEYTFRYGKIHKSKEVISWCAKNVHLLSFEEYEMTPFVQAMPWEYKNDSVTVAYRGYYIGEKARFAKWTKRKPPAWFVVEKSNEDDAQSNVQNIALEDSWLDKILHYDEFES